MNRLALLTLVGVLGASAVHAQAPAFDSSKAWDHLRQQINIGPRPSGSPANVKTRDYIKAQLTALGIKPVEQPFEGATPLGPVKMVNLIGTIPGKSADRIILASHFDTKLFKNMRFVGASDGASSTAALLEIADAADVPALAGNPFVAASGVRSYAAVELTSVERTTLGLIAVADRRPGALSPRGRAALLEAADEARWLV